MRIRISAPTSSWYGLASTPPSLPLILSLVASPTRTSNPSRTNSKNNRSCRDRPLCLSFHFQHVPIKGLHRDRNPHQRPYCPDRQHTWPADWRPPPQKHSD